MIHVTLVFCDNDCPMGPKNEFVSAMLYLADAILFLEPFYRLRQEPYYFIETYSETC